MVEFQRLAHCLAQRDIEIITQVILDSAHSNYDVKQILLNYQSYLQQQQLSISRDSLIYKTLLKMSLVTHYKLPAVYSISSTSGQGSASDGEQVTWDQRIEMAYQWLFYDHIYRVFREYHLQKRALLGLLSKRRIAGINSHTSPRTTLEESRSLSHYSPEVTEKSLKSLLFERLQQQLQSSRHVSQLLHSQTGVPSLNSQHSSDKESRDMEQDHTAESASTFSQKSSNISKSASGHTETETRPEISLKSRTSSQESSITASRDLTPTPVLPLSPLPLKEEISKPKKIREKPNEGLTLNDSFEEFLKQQLKLDEDLDERLKSVSSLELTESSPKNLNETEHVGKPPAPQTIDPSSRGDMSDLELSKQVVRGSYAHLSIPLGPQTESSFMNRTPEQLEAQSEAISIIAAIDTGDIVTADEIIELCAFKGVIHQTIERINRLLIEHAFRGWRVRIKQIVCCRLKMQRCFVRYYVFSAFANMRALMRHNTLLIDSAEGFENHLCNVLCIKAMKQLKAQAASFKSSVFEQNAVSILLQKRLFLVELEDVENQIENEQKSDKFEYFKQESIVKLNHSAACITRELAEVDGNNLTFSRRIEVIRRCWLVVFPSIAAIRDCYYNRENSVKYMAILHEIQSDIADDAFLSVFLEIKSYMPKGYDIIPAACHTLRRPIDYLNFLYSCWRFEAGAKQHFLRELALNAAHVRETVDGFMLATKFRHWRRSAQFRKRMHNIDEFVTDYHEQKILKKRAISSLLMEAGHRKLIALISPGIERRIACTALLALRSAVKERRLSKRGFLMDVDELRQRKDLKRAFYRILQKFEHCQAAFQAIQRNRSSLLRRFAFSCVLQTTAVALLRQMHFQRAVFSAKRKILLCARKLFNEQIVAEQIRVQVSSVYMRVALSAMRQKLDEMQRAEMIIGRGHRIKNIALPFFVWKHRYHNLNAAFSLLERQRLSKQLVAYTTILFEQGRLLYKYERYVQMKRFEQLFSIMYTLRQSRMNNDARRKNAMAYFIVKWQTALLKTTFRFWCGFAGLEERMRAIEEVRLETILQHWRSLAADKAHFVQFRPHLEKIKAIADEEGYEVADCITDGKIEEFAIRRANCNPSFDKGEYLLACPVKYSFTRRLEPSARETIMKTLTRMLTYFRDGVPCLENDYYLLRFAFQELHTNVIRLKNLCHFFKGLRECLDTTLKRMALMSMNEQRIKEIRLVRLIETHKLGIERTAFSSLRESLMNIVNMAFRALHFETAMSLRISIAIWRTKVNRDNAISYYLAKLRTNHAAKHVIDNWFSATKCIIASFCECKEQHDMLIKKKALDNLRKRANLYVVVTAIETKASVDNKAELRRVFEMLIERANEFIQFHNNEVDRIESKALKAVVKRSSELHDHENEVYSMRQRILCFKVFCTLCRTLKECEIGMEMLVAKNNQIVSKLFSEWRKCSKLANTNLLVKRECDITLLRRIFVTLLRIATAHYLAAAFNCKREVALKRRIGHYVFEIAGRLAQSDLLQERCELNMQRHVFEKWAEKASSLFKAEHTLMNGLQNDMRRQAFLAILEKHSRFEAIERRVIYLEREEDTQLEKLALGTWAIYCVRMQAVRLARGDIERRRTRISLLALEMKQFHLEKAEESTYEMSLQELLGKSLHFWRNFSRKNIFWNTTVKKWQANMQSTIQRRTLHEMLSKARILFDAENRLCFLREARQQNAVLSKFFECKCELETMSARAISFNDTLTKEKVFDKWLNRSCTTMCLFEQIEHKANKSILEMSFYSMRKIAKLKVLFTRMRLRIIIVRWAAEIRATRQNMWRAEQLRKAEVFSAREGRVLVHHCFQELKLSALKREQMSHAADAFFWRNGEYFHLWREAAWAQRRRSRQ